MVLNMNAPDYSSTSSTSSPQEKTLHPDLPTVPKTKLELALDAGNVEAIDVGATGFKSEMTREEIKEMLVDALGPVPTGKEWSEFLDKLGFRTVTNGEIEGYVVKPITPLNLAREIEPMSGEFKLYIHDSNG